VGLEGWPVQGLGENVSHIFHTRDKCEKETLLQDMLPDKVVQHINVLGLGVADGILDEGNAGLIVTLDF
jgi:hypothetical protein